MESECVLCYNAEKFRKYLGLLMAIRKIVETPHPLLREKSLPVLSFDKNIEILIEDMIETMYHENGAGLAAVQVGDLKRIFIVDVGGKEDENKQDLHVFVNPEIIHFSDNHVVMPEGCLSFPGGRVDIARPEIVTINYLDNKGSKQSLQADGWLSRAIQHEYDHIEGVLLVDRVSQIKKDLFLKKVHKNQKDGKK